MAAIAQMDNELVVSIDEGDTRLEVGNVQQRAAGVEVARGLKTVLVGTNSLSWLSRSDSMRQRIALA